MLQPRIWRNGEVAVLHWSVIGTLDAFARAFEHSLLFNYLFDLSPHLLLLLIFDMIGEN